MYPELKFQEDPIEENDYVEDGDKDNPMLKFQGNPKNLGSFKKGPSAPQLDFILSDPRVSAFLTEKSKLEDLLVHYKKIKSRWTRADSILKISGICLGGFLAISSAITSGLGPALVFTAIPVILGGASATNLFLSESISIGLTSRKKKIYREVCDRLEVGICQLYLFQLKALEDNNLSFTEITEAKKIVSEIKNQMAIIKNQTQKIT